MDKIRINPVRNDLRSKSIEISNRVKDLSSRELEGALAGLAIEPYRARQIFRWLYKSAVRSFDEMTDISADSRRALESKFRLSYHEILDLKGSLSDGTTKYLFKLEDANTIESVYRKLLEKKPL